MFLTDAQSQIDGQSLTDAQRLPDDLAGRVRSHGLSAPITVTWEVTNRCNLRCTHCLSDSGPDAPAAGELNLEEAKGVVDTLAEAKVFQIHFGGGEPFVYPGFFDLLRHAQARGFCCLCISTNGSLLDARRIAELDAMGGIYLQISLDGADAATCDAVRGEGAHARALAALERLRATSIVRTINFVYCRHNAHELDAMAALAARYEATLRVTRLKPSGRGASTYSRLRPTQAQLAELRLWLERNPEVLTGDSFFHLNAFGGKPLDGFSFCGAARMTCLITPNGDVFPCAFTQQDVFRAGNLRQEAFSTLWREAPVFNRVFRDAPEGACGACPAHDGCGGGCPAVKHAVAGRLDIPDPDCVLETARAMNHDRPQSNHTAHNTAPLCAD